MLYGTKLLRSEMGRHLAGSPWHEAVDKAAVLASADATQEAEGAARNAIKHVYILAGYAEPPRATSAACKKTRVEPEQRKCTEAETICKARAVQDSSATTSSNSKAEDRTSNDR